MHNDLVTRGYLEQRFAEERGVTRVLIETALTSGLRPLESQLADMRNATAAAQLDARLAVQGIGRIEKVLDERLIPLTERVTRGEAAIGRWTRAESALMVGVKLVAQVPLLAGVKKLFAWGVTLFGGAALGSFLFLIFQ